jgi:ubiquitin C-terminal hydrolase
MRTCSNCYSKILSYQTFPYLILDLEKTRKKIFMSDMEQYHKSKIDNELWQTEYYHNRENIPIKLIDCVDYYCTYQNNFNFFCPKCKTNCLQTTVNKIYTSPNIFIFILNRGKNNIFQVKMDYPPQLDMSKYVETTNKSPTKYELTGVITHLGVSGPNGHFIAFCKNIMDGKWYKYNDEIVTEADNFSVHNEGIAYILFYNMVGKSRDKI